MGKTSAPAAPDPYASAAAQAQFGEQAASYNSALNNVNTQGPNGSVSYAITGHDPTTGAPIYTQTTALSDPEQQILSGAQQQSLSSQGVASGVTGELRQELGGGIPTINPVQYSASGAPIQTSLDTSNVPGIVSPMAGYNYGQSTALAGEEAAMKPGLDQQREQLDSSLRNSGAVPGDPAYDNAMASLNASQTASQTQAAGSAITAGQGLSNQLYGESANTNSQLFGQDAQKMSAENTAAGQQFSENAQNAALNNSAGTTALQNWANELGVPISALSGLMGGNGVSMPTSSTPTTSQTSAPNIMQAFQNQYSGQLAQYNAGVATTNADVSAAAALAAAYIGSAATAA